MTNVYDEPIRRITFLRRILSKSLIKEHLIIRAQIQSLPRDQMAALMYVVVQQKT